MLSAAAARAQTPSVPSEDSPLPKWMKYDLQLRGRLERDIGFKTIKGIDDTDFQSRIRVGLRFEAAPWLHFYMQAQDAEVASFHRGTAPASMADSMDFYQGYVELGNLQSSAWAARIGRQEIGLGEARLVGDMAWANSGKSFDAIRLRYNRPGVHLDWFASAAVVPLQPRFDHPQLKNGFYGFYSSFDRLIPKVAIEPYFFWKVMGGVRGELGLPGAQSEYTSGVRAAGVLAGKTTFSVDTSFQTGHCAEDRIRAWAGHYSIAVPLRANSWSPRWMAEFNHASGDNGVDGRRGTFDALYANNHDKYGFMDRFSWRNLNDIANAIEVKPVNRWTAKAALHYFWLANKNDAIWSSGGMNVKWANATSSQLGPELDLQAAYSFNRHLDIVGGFSHLWAGEYIRHATTYAASSYPYLILLYRM